MPTTYSVNIWKTKPHKGKRITAYYVRWSVDGRGLHKSFRNKAQADSFRAELTIAARGRSIRGSDRPSGFQRAPDPRLVLVRNRLPIHGQEMAERSRDDGQSSKP